MKILFVSHENDLNGASKSLLNIISKLDKNNQIFVLLPHKNGLLYEELLKYDVRIIVEPYYRWSLKLNKKFFYFLLRWYLYGWLVNKRTAKKLAQIVRNEKIDIVHSNSSVVNIGGLIAKYANVKHVWHIREFGDLDFNMHHFMPQTYYKHFMNNNCNKFICISKAVYSHYTFLDESKMRVIYNGVDDCNIINKDYKDKEDVIFLICGRIEKAKGQETVIKASELLLDRGIKNFKVFIAGRGNIDIPEKLKGVVTLLGFINNIPDLRKNIDVEIVSSKAEAFGRSTVEAMLGGIPVIGSNSGGTKELIEDGINGLLFETNDSVDLSEKMEFFIKQRFKIKELGINAKKSAMKSFLIDRCVDEIVDVYKEILEKE